MASSLAKNETPVKCQALVLRMSIVNNWALRVLIGNANINQETEQEVSSWRQAAVQLVMIAPQPALSLPTQRKTPSGLGVALSGLFTAFLLSSSFSDVFPWGYNAPCPPSAPVTMAVSWYLYADTEGLNIPVFMTNQRCWRRGGFPRIAGRARAHRGRGHGCSSRALAMRPWCRAGVGQDLLSPHRWQPPQRCEIQPGLALTNLTVLQNNSSSKPGLFVRKGPLLKHHCKLQRFLLSSVQTSWSAPTAVALNRTWAPSALWL